jgi:hypothetical protein
MLVLATLNQTPKWHISTYSDSGNCVEVALVTDDRGSTAGVSVLVRSSHAREGHVLALPGPRWRGFLIDLAAGEFDPR